MTGLLTRNVGRYLWRDIWTCVVIGPDQNTQVIEVARGKEGGRGRREGAELGSLAIGVVLYCNFTNTSTYSVVLHALLLFL